MTQNSNNQKFTNNADGFDLAGGTTARKITLSGADVDVVGSGTAVITFPSATSTLATLALAETLTNKDLSAASNTLGSANVTAAGALMDSEVTNLAQVKAFDTTDYVTPTGTETLTNKRINKRTSTTTSTTTLTPSPANYDVYTLTAQAGALTIANPTGTINIGDTIAIYVYTAAAQTLTFGNYYEAYSAALPTTTTAGKKMLITLQADTATTLSVLSAVQQ